MTSHPLMAMRGIAPPIQRVIPIRNAWVARVGIRFFSDALNDWTPYVGATDVRVRFSQFETGFTFEGYPSTLVGPFPMLETSDPGWYYFPIGADIITRALASLVGQTIYQIIESAYGTYAYYFDLTTSEPLLVTDPRSPIT